MWMCNGYLRRRGPGCDSVVRRDQTYLQDTSR